ncbi:hypothetical protein [Ulvibacter antarcticus]|uniref:Uncharacterized protein n=1 Tax=Ulvibacter antarcticus TaxID=442714 RepID=A0A3L9ZCD2_9FLAO|nr:hypothetical protein [Ulvibacter antarcticus]RMA64292.1 hypothetical protein BXY75_1165 [Ulvibacter antarcticus]
MNCEQKSGVFLNMNCINSVEETCSNCEKQICKPHSHVLDTNMLCEDCYWERFIYDKEKKAKEYFDNNEHRLMDSTRSTPISSNSSETPSFEGGFGGGGFGGGGASGEWSEADAGSFTETAGGAAAAGLMGSETDDTFFYS